MAGAALVAPYLQEAGQAADALAADIERVLASATSPAEVVAELVVRRLR